MNIIQLPRLVWILWYQGNDRQPFIVQKCIESWIQRNPSWNVIVLDSSKVHEYINIAISPEKLSTLTLAHQSDLVRLALLNKYGGIWADATTFCTKPLDEWIDSATSSGFFAFRNPGKDRVMSNWFMAAQPECPITLRLFEQLTDYWEKNSFNKPNRFQRQATKLFSKLLNQSPRTSKFWLSPIFSRILKIQPYFLFHYMFYRVVSLDEECKNTWNKTVKMNAVAPLSIQRIGLFTECDELMKDKIEKLESPLHKLTWKYNHAKYSNGTILHYILENNNHQQASENSNPMN